MSGQITSQLSVMATGTVFTVSNLTADTHIEGITIVANAPGIPGASTYGVRMATGGGALGSPLREISKRWP